MPQLYNFFWVNPARRAARAPVALRRRATLDTPPDIEAIIMYPALMTPGVHVAVDPDTNFLEFILLGRSDQPPITASVVNQRLKYTTGLDPQKHYDDVPLTGDVAHDIVVATVTPDGNGILRSHTKFKGIMHPSFRQHLPAAFDTYYKVQVKATVLAQGGAGSIPGREYQDDVIWAMMGRRHGSRLPDTGRFSFRVRGNSVDVAHADHAHPILAYHPLVVFTAEQLPDWASFAHVSDIHLNTRQELMRRTPARVIEATAEYPTQVDQESRAIGEIMNLTTNAFAEVINSVPSDVHALLVGGDLIDHIKNAWAAWGPSDTKTVREVWDVMDMGDNYETNYQAFTDYISFYSLIGHFYRTKSLPVFCISGNHDCYKEAFGISPRVCPMGVKRANEGIPADNNLTFYEAILAFGRSWDQIKQSFNFEPELFEWFYKVLTPWADFSVPFRRQRLVGLAWGEHECMIEVVPSGQGLGHLPRADQSVNDGQMAMFIEGLSEDTPTVLMTHFTFVSYNDPISIVDLDNPTTEQNGRPGTVDLRPGNFGDLDMGTFDEHRLAMYSRVANSDSVQAVFTGHSHRKGLYFLNRRALVLDTPTTMFNFDHQIELANLPSAVREETPIIVSDSAGPLPRFNREGEFGGWGSDTPAGTVAYFGHRLQRVRAIRASSSRGRPRLAVALDYHHWMQDQVFEHIVTDWFGQFSEDESDLGIRIQLKSHLTSQFHIGVERVVFYNKAADSTPWVRCEAANSGGRWVVPAAQREAFSDWLNFGPTAGRFISLKLGIGHHVLRQKYSTADHWNFEVHVDTSRRPSLSHGMEKRYSIVNPDRTIVAVTGGAWYRNTPEAPSFSWRERIYS
jgi:hypothetical protein